MASSLFVVLPIAETTTTGCRSSLALTISATRPIAAADSTEVPPNFITIIDQPLILTQPATVARAPRRAVSTLVSPRLLPESQQPLNFHQLRVQHRRPCRAPHRIMPQRDEL